MEAVVVAVEWPRRPYYIDWVNVNVNYPLGGEPVGDGRDLHDYCPGDDDPEEEGVGRLDAHRCRGHPLAHRHSWRYCS